MTAHPELAPGVPPDYYERIMAAEQANFWYREMEATASALLGHRLNQGLRVLDAGCGAGGFLRFLLDTGSFGSAAGVDLAGAALDLARHRIPEADLRQAPLHELPFEDGSFELVVSNDVLQHIDELEMPASLAEIRRVLARPGTLLVRTNGYRQLRRERSDWRVYDRAALRRELERAGFTIERLTYANCTLSLAAAVRGRVPRAPSITRHGVPSERPSRMATLLGRAALRAEARWLGRGGSLPYGHTLLAVASVQG